MFNILGSGTFCLILSFTVTVTAEVFIAYEQNGQSVYDAWKSRSFCNELPPIKQTGKGKHLRSHVIDFWSEIKVKMVKVELYKNNVQVLWMTFHGINTNNMDWFSKSNLHQSSFTDLSQCSTTNHFSIYGDVHDAVSRRFNINKYYNGCFNDFGWFTVLEAQDVCSWARFNKYPIFMYTKNSRIWQTDAETADTLVISVQTEL